jgi:hypothetical protein
MSYKFEELQESSAKKSHCSQQYKQLSLVLLLRRSLIEFSHAVMFSDPPQDIDSEQIPGPGPTYPHGRIVQASTIPTRLCGVTSRGTCNPKAMNTLASQERER